MANGKKLDFPFLVVLQRVSDEPLTLQSLLPKVTLWVFPRSQPEDILGSLTTISFLAVKKLLPKVCSCCEHDYEQENVEELYNSSIIATRLFIHTVKLIWRAARDRLRCFISGNQRNAPVLSLQSGEAHFLTPLLFNRGWHTLGYGHCLCICLYVSMYS